MSHMYIFVDYNDYKQQEKVTSVKAKQLIMKEKLVNFQNCFTDSVKPSSTPVTKKFK